MSKEVILSKEDAKKFLIILSPFAPYISEELWHGFSKKESSVHDQQWPIATADVQEENTTIAIMINGKLRSTIILNKSVSLNKQREIERIAKDDEKVGKYLENQKIKKVFYVTGKAINFVI